jgi:hypothetical protein
MGIRFKCHLCEAELNIKADLANKRGVCPTCRGKFRIPKSTQAYSLPIDITPTESSFEATVSQGLSTSSPIVPMTVTEPSQEIERSSATAVAAESSSKDSALALDQLPEPLFMVRPPSGGEYGPAAKSTIEEWIGQRRVTGDSMVCQLGTSEWRKAKEVFVMKFVFG